MAAPTRGVPQVIVPGRWWDTVWVDSGVWWRLRWFVGVPLLVVCIGILIWEINTIYTAPSWLQREVGLIWGVLFAGFIATYILPIHLAASSRSIGLGPDGLYADFGAVKRVYPWSQVHFIAPRRVSVGERRSILLTSEQAERVVLYLREHPDATLSATRPRE